MMHTGQKLTFRYFLIRYFYPELMQFKMLWPNYDGNVPNKSLLYHNFKKSKIIPNNLLTNKKIKSFSFTKLYRYFRLNFEVLNVGWWLFHLFQKAKNYESLFKCSTYSFSIWWDFCNMIILRCFGFWVKKSSSGKENFSHFNRYFWQK